MWLLSPFITLVFTVKSVEFEMIKTTERQASKRAKQQRPVVGEARISPVGRSIMTVY